MENYVPHFAVDDATEPRVTDALETLGIDWRRERADESDRATEIVPTDHASVLGRALVVLGAPQGEKSDRSAFSLPEYLDDDDFVSHVVAHRDGRKRLAQLRGMFAWWDTRTDRPPPGALADEQRLLGWLEDQGETFMPEPSQVSLFDERVMG